MPFRAYGIHTRGVRFPTSHPVLLFASTSGQELTQTQPFIQGYVGDFSLMLEADYS